MMRATLAKQTVMCMVHVYSGRGFTGSHRYTDYSHTCCSVYLTVEKTGKLRVAGTGKREGWMEAVRG